MLQIRRIRKEDVKINTWIKPDGMSHCLDCWKNWMSKNDRDLGESKMRFDSLSAEDDAADYDGAYESDPWQDQRLADNFVGAATGAMIDSLKRIEIWAIYESCGIGKVWKFPNADLINTYQSAIKELENKLKKNIATAIFF